jgi:hypothetical protein
LRRVLGRKNMTTHYPHTAADENKQGLHYSEFSGLIHRPDTDP